MDNGDDCTESNATIIEVVLANIGPSTYGSGKFLLPSKLPTNDISKYRVVYDESRGCYEVCHRSIRHFYKAENMPKIVLASPSANHTEVEPFRYSITRPSSKCTIVPKDEEAVTITTVSKTAICVEDAHAEEATTPNPACKIETNVKSPVSPTPCSEPEVSKGTYYRSPSGFHWAAMVEDEEEGCEDEQDCTPSKESALTTAFVPEDILGSRFVLPAITENGDLAQMTAKSQTTALLIPEYYVSPTGQDRATMDEEEHFESGANPPPEAYSNACTDSEPLSPVTPISTTSSDSDKTHLEKDSEREDLSSKHLALNLYGLPEKHDVSGFTGDKWRKRWNDNSCIQGLDLQMREVNYETYKTHAYNYMQQHNSHWTFIKVKAQEHPILAEHGNPNDETAIEESETDYSDADGSRNALMGDNMSDASYDLPNLRQYVPEYTTEEVNAVLSQIDDATRSSPIANQYARGVIDWTHMCRASKAILASGSYHQTCLEEADRSVDWFWDVVRDDGSTAFHYRGCVKPQSTPNSTCNAIKTEEVHHYNFCGNPVDTKSATPPAVSMWFAFSPGVTEHAKTASKSMHKQVLMSQAGKYLDPFSYSGPKVFRFMQGTALQEFATGLAEKVYIPEGIWMTDYFGRDEGKPQCSTYVSNCFDGSYDTLNHPLQPYVISAGNDGDTVTNDGQRLHPMNVSKTRAPVGARSNLWYIQAVDDMASDIVSGESVRTSQSPEALLLDDCQAVIAQLTLAANPTEKTDHKVVTSFGERDIAACLKSSIELTAIEVGSILSEVNLLLDQNEKQHLDKECDVLKERLRCLIDPSGQPVDNVKIVEDTSNPSTEPVEKSTTNTIIVRLPIYNIHPIVTESVNIDTKNVAPSYINQLCQAEVDVSAVQHFNVGVDTQETRTVNGTTSVPVAIDEAVVDNGKDFVLTIASEDCGSPSAIDLVSYDEDLANEDLNEGSGEISSDNTALEEMGLDGSAGELEPKILEQSAHQALRWQVLTLEKYAASTDSGLLEELSGNPEALASPRDMSESLHDVEDQSSLNTSQFKRPGFIHEDDSLEGISFFSTPTKRGLESWLNEGDSKDQALLMPEDNADEDHEEPPAKASRYKRPEAALGFRSKNVVQYKDDFVDDLSAIEEGFEDSGMDSDEYSPDKSGRIIDCWPESEDEEQGPAPDIFVKVIDVENVADNMTAPVSVTKPKKGCDACSKPHGPSVKLRPKTLESKRNELKKPHQKNSSDAHNIMSPHITNGIAEDQIVCIAADGSLPRSAISVLASPHVATRENIATKVEYLEALIPNAYIPEVKIPELLLPPPILPVASISEMLVFYETTSLVVIPESNLPALQTLDSTFIDQDSRQQDVLNAHQTSTMTDCSPPRVTAQHPDMPVPTNVTADLSAIVIDSVIIGDDEFADDSEVENCVLSSDEVDVKERAWVLEYPDYLQVDHNAVEEDVPKDGKYYGVDFDLLEIGNGIPANTHAVSEVTNVGHDALRIAFPLALSCEEEFKKQLNIAILIPLPAEDEDELRHEEAVEELEMAQEQLMETAEPLNQEVGRPVSAMSPGSKTDEETQSTVFDCGGLLDFTLPRPKLGDCLLYGSIAAYLGYRIYSAFR